MDANYLRQIIGKLEAERAIHDEKFAGRAEHKDCLPRFDAAISRLLEQMELQPRMDFSVSESVLPDAIAEAPELERVASELLEAHDNKAASAVKREAELIVMHELNEIDGFPRESR